MKQMIKPAALLLSLALTLSPALAAGTPEGADPGRETPPVVRAYEGFSDVKEDDWFTPYVKVCYEAGLLSGTGGGNFSPNKVLSQAECLTLALRLYDIQRGGTGTLAEAPESWGKLTMTLADGTQLSAYGGDLEHWAWFGFRHFDVGELCWVLKPEQKDWAEAQRYTEMTLTAGERVFPGEVACAMPLADWWLRFIPHSSAVEESEEEINTLLQHTLYYCPGPQFWYRNTHYTLSTLPETEQTPFLPLADVRDANDSATRQSFALAVSAAAGELEAINQISRLPDSGDSVVLDLYRAGILSGVDESGAFAPGKTLTRAEAAAMAARVLSPALRLSFSLQEPVFQDYDLKPLYASDGKLSACVSSDLLLFLFPDERGAFTVEKILRADGSRIDLPENSDVAAWNESGLISLQRVDDATQSGYVRGVLDGNTGELVLPFGAYSQLVLLKDGQFLTRAEAKEGVEQPLQLWDAAGNPIAALTTGPAEWTAYSNGLAPCLDKDSGLWGYVNLKGDWVIAPQWKTAAGFEKGYAMVGTGEKWGLINPAGEILIPCQYEYLDYLGGGLCRGGTLSNPIWVRLDGVPSATLYDAAKVDTSIQNGYIPYNDCYLNMQFQPVTRRIFQWTGPVSEDGSAFVWKDGGWYRLTFQQKEAP